MDTIAYKVGSTVCHFADDLDVFWPWCVDRNGTMAVGVMALGCGITAVFALLLARAHLTSAS